MELQNEIDRQQKRLEATQKEYDDYVAHVDNSREETRKAQRALDKALKEIASWNDEIVKAASSRHAVYRRCRLEEIDLPLISGRLDKVPIEEVISLLSSRLISRILTPWKLTTTRRWVSKIGEWNQTLRYLMTKRKKCEAINFSG